MADEKEVEAIKKLHEVVAAINALEGLPVVYGLAMKLNDTAKSIEQVIKFEERRNKFLEPR